MRRFHLLALSFAKATQRWHRQGVLLGRIAAAVALVVLLTWTWLNAGPPPDNVDFFPLNGSFQNYNPLRRLNLGQTPGFDFQLYLGLGVNGIMALATRTGDTFGDSLFCVRLLCGVLFLGNLLFLGGLARLPWTANVGLAAALTLHASGVSPHLGPDCLSGLRGMYLPGNSVLGLRCVLPSLCAAVFLLAGRVGALQNGWGQALLYGVVASLALPWSNDYGPCTALAIGLLWGLPQLRQWRACGLRPARCGAQGLFLVLVASVGAWVWINLATRGHGQLWWDYNTKGVAADQFWYFQGSKWLSLRDFPMAPMLLWAWLLLGTLGWRAAKCTASPMSLRFRAQLLAFVLLTTLLAGLVGSSGALSPHYFVPAKLVALYAALFVGRAAYRLYQRGRRVPWLYWGSATGGVFMGTSAMILAGLAVGPWVSTARQHLASRRGQGTPGTLLAAPELGGYLPQRYDKMLALGRALSTDLRHERPEHRLFSTYAGALDIVAGAVQPSGFDYIIHALGPQARAAYVQTLQGQAPPFVTTLRETFTPWETWIRRVNWDFYRELLAHYRPIDQTFYSTLWARHEGGVVDSLGSVACAVDSHSPFFTDITLTYPRLRPVPWGEVRWVEVALTYRSDMRINRLWNGVLRQVQRVREVRSARSSPLLNFPVDEESFYIPPPPVQGTTWRFLVEAHGDVPAVLRLQSLPEGIARLSVDACVAKDITSKAQVDDFALLAVHPSSLSDKTWSRGVALAGQPAGFTVSDSTDLRHLQPGQHLDFRHSGPRNISQIDGATVRVEGGPLDPVEDGYPHAVTVLQ